MGNFKWSCQPPFEVSHPEDVKKFFAIITFEYASTAKYCISAINRKMYKGNRKNEITVKMVEYHPNRQVYANIPSEALSSKTPIDNFNQIVFWNSTEHKIKSMSSTVAWDKTTPIDLRNEMVQAIVSRISVHLYKGYLVKIVKRRKNGHFKVVFETDPLSGEEFEKASATRQANDLAKAEHWAVCNAYKSRRHAGSTNAIIVVSYMFAEVNSPDRLKLFVGTLLHELLHAYGFRKNNERYLMVVDLVNKATNRIIWKFEWKELSVWYWLAEDIITLFSEKKEPNERIGECYSQFVYKCDFKDPKSELELIQKRDIPFACDPIRSEIYKPVDPARIELNGHDFLFVKSFEFQLVPFNPLGGPSLPGFCLNLVDFLHRFDWEGHERCHTTPEFQFACYKNKIYFQLNKREWNTEWKWICDRFFVIELTDFNLTTRKIETAPLDFDNPNIVTFKRLTPGTFELPLTLTWQEGPIVIIYEMSHNRQNELLAERKVVIVDL